MCEFCDITSDNDEKAKLAKEHALMLANNFKRMSIVFEKIAFNKLNPHSDQIQEEVGLLPKVLMRELVEWI